MLGAGVIGQTPDALHAATGALSAFLRDDGPVPAGWPGLGVFAAARAHRARHASIMLAFQAAGDAAHAAVAVAA